MCRIITSLRRYKNYMDALFIVVFIYVIYSTPIYKSFASVGKKAFFSIFGTSEMVENVAQNSVFGLLWIILPIVLILSQKNSIKELFIKKGKKTGWIVGFSLLFIFIITSLLIAYNKGVRVKIIISLFPLGLTYALINAIKEEILFRGLIFSRILPFGFIFSLICQFFMFGLIHLLYGGGEGMGFAGLILSGILGVILALMTKKFDGLASPILFHAGLDFLLFMGVLVPQFYS
jgi:membrane protease YdiL (CAAX protease family)